MNLNYKYDFFINHSLFNINDCDVVTYYCPEKKIFEVHSWSFENNQGLIPAPFADEHRNLTWKFFWESLDDNEKTLAHSYSGPGFFSFMRETGLDARFGEAEIRMKKEIIEEWERANNLVINYDHALVVDFDD